MEKEDKYEIGKQGKKNDLEVIIEEDNNENYFSTTKKRNKKEKNEEINKKRLIKPDSSYNINSKNEEYQDSNIINSDTYSYYTGKEEENNMNKKKDETEGEDEIQTNDFNNNKYSNIIKDENSNYNIQKNNNNKSTFNDDENKLKKYFIIQDKKSENKFKNSKNNKNVENENKYNNKIKEESDTIDKKTDYNMNSKDNDTNNDSGVINNKKNDNEISKKSEDRNDNDEDDNQAMELYSYEGSEINAEDKNDGINEEYYINKNIIEFQRQNKETTLSYEVSESDINNNNEVTETENNNNDNYNDNSMENYTSNLDNASMTIGKESKEKQIYKNENFFNMNNFQKNQINNNDSFQPNDDRKKSKIIQLNNFKINNFSVNFFNNNKGDISNENNIKSTIEMNIKNDDNKGQDKKISSVKGAMNIFGLLMSQKDQKEKLNKKFITLDEVNRTIENNDINRIIKNRNNNIINRINKAKISLKNANIPYKRIKMNLKKYDNNISNNKNDIKNDGKLKINVNKISDFIKLKEEPSIEIMSNTNPSSIRRKKRVIKNTFFNNYMLLEKLDKKKNNNNFKNKEDNSMMLHNKPYNSIENSFHNMTIYKKRIIKNKYFSVSTSPRRMDSNKTPIFQKRNTYTKYQFNQANQAINNNFNLNTFNKNNKNSKNINISTAPSFNNYNYYSTKTESLKNTILYNFNNINNSKDNISANSVINNIKKKYVINSRTSNSSRSKNKDLMFYNTNDEENSDNIEKCTQYYSNKTYNNIFGNFIKKQRDKRITDYNNTTNYEKNNHKTFNDSYQSFSFRHQKNNKIKKRIFNNTLYYDKSQFKNINNLNKIQKYNNYENINFSVDDAGYKKSNKNISITINIEDIIILVEKVNEIIYLIKNRKEVKKQCYEFWNYFFNLKLHQKIEKICKTEKDIKILRITIYNQLLSIMLCYEFSFDKNILYKTFFSLLEVLELNYCNLMLICQNIVNKISKENKVNEWVLKLNKVIHNSNKVEGQTNQNKTNIEKMNFINDKIGIKLNKILMNYKTEYSALIMGLLETIKEKTYEQINDFFQERILRKDNNNNNKNNQKKTVFLPIRFSYVLSKRMKPYTLVIIEKTIFNYKTMNNQSVMTFRPFLIEFLEILSQYYELILFSAETLNTIEPIIKVIQRKKNYFDYIFYRENNNNFIGNEYNIDLKKIGRPLNSTIIIDNFQQSSRLQKDNRINIKSFSPYNSKDRTLYNLILILINIAKEKTDVRYGLTKYREEINRKVA